MRLQLTLGTRDSQLALWQAQTVAALVRKTGNACELKTIRSYGDDHTDRPLAEVGTEIAGKGIFTKALDDALLDGGIDLAVHSLKDIPTRLPAGIFLAAILPREDPRDVLVPRVDTSFLEQAGYPATIATGSTRRQAQWHHRYPHHRVVDLRGNVQTRLRKLYDGAWDGAVFAAAGLKRLGLLDPSQLQLGWMLPAPGQGAVAAVCRADDYRVRDLLAQLNDTPSAACTTAERTVLRVLEGGCSAPVAAYATLEQGIVQLQAAVLHPDGSTEVTATAHGDDPQALGEQVAESLLAQGAGALLAAAQTPPAHG